MQIFELQRRILGQYGSFLRSFIHIKDEKIRTAVDEALAEGKLLPEPLIQFNPAYRKAGSVADLCEREGLAPALRDTFKGYELYQHQIEAIRLGTAKTDFIVTSGTGSGKSLTYIATIFDHLLRHPLPGGGVCAIIVYPMNALINSQEIELRKYEKNYLSKHPGREFPIRYKKYTGQEKEEEKKSIRENPPDILLTNYMMLELLMTRSGEHSLRENIRANLQFLAFDELHTYRGRQGSDIALLIRRIQAQARQSLVLMGTSATLVSGDDIQAQKRGVAELAKLIFGRDFQPHQVVNESLEIQTASGGVLPSAAALREAIHHAPIDQEAPEAQLRAHPLALWLENRVVLERRDDWIRRGRPRSMQEMAAMLAEDCDEDPAQCEQQLLELLNWSENLAQAKKARSIFPFKLHQFISQTGNVYVSLDPLEQRFISLEPGYYINAGGSAQKPIFPVVFSRVSGHEFICVRKNIEHNLLEPRAFQDTMIEEESAEHLEAGYLIVPQRDEEIWDEAHLEFLPDSWIQFSKKRGSWEAKPDYRQRLPQKLFFEASGRYSETEPLESWGWYMPAKLLFDPTSGTFYDPRTKDYTKLMSLGNEGRSTATTTLSYAIIHELHRAGLTAQDQKLLSFTDNRQDAALQSGHFNDYIQTAQIRSAIYHALERQPEGLLDYASIADQVFQALNLPQEDYAVNPASSPGARRDNEDALKEYLMTRILLDLKRGWRVIMPNLEQCGLLNIRYKHLEEDAAAEEFWADLDGLNRLSAEQRYRFIESVLDFFRTSYAIYYHKLNNPRMLQDVFRQKLRQPWTIDVQESIETPAYLRLGSPPSGRGSRGFFTNSIGTNSALGKYVKYTFKEHGLELKGEIYLHFMERLLQKLSDCGYLKQEQPGSDPQAYSLWQLDVSKIQWMLGDGETVKRDAVRMISYKQDFNLKPNAYFRQLYQQSFRAMKPIEGREHTGQLGYEDRIEREKKFRDGEISALFCSPTMELGIDIANLNIVHMRNVPPSPANYAQRSGRAGRSGQGALVFTYCSSFAPHDRHYFKYKEDMIAGVVAPPKMDLSNRDLLLSHLHALYLAELGLEGIERSVAEVIDMETYPRLPLKREVQEKLKEGHERRCAKVLVTAQAILAGMGPLLGQANWNTEDFLQSHIANIPQVFDQALNRWRELYRSATEQLERAQAVLKNQVYGPSSEERRNAWNLEKHAVRQLDLLRNDAGKRGSDLSEFYPYRYLASEGFLPGYNFTRLPLRAFLAGGKQDGEFISRARFVALREFGPRNLIYHNGAKYNIRRMNIPDAGSRLEKAKISKHSGYFFSGEEYDANLCPVTDTPLENDSQRDLLMDLIPMFETTGEVQERISCEEEERTSTGFDIKTYFSVTGGFAQMKPIEVWHGDDLLLRMYFIPAANIYQVNTRWRRAQRRGFPLGLRSGFWKREKEMEEGTANPNAEEVRRVMPFTSGNADSLYIQPLSQLNLPRQAVTTLLYALKRAVERCYQAESNEVGAYLMGETEHPNILLFEAAEGSLGILSQIARSPDAFLEVVRDAYRLCWFEDGQDVHPDAPNSPVASYDDLLSYYNQRDHGIINRFDIQAALELLLHCRISLAPPAPYHSIAHQAQSLAEESDPNSKLEERFIRYLHQHRLRLPDKTQVQMSAINGLYIQPDFVYEPNVAVFIDGAVHDRPEVKADDEIKRKALRHAGWQVLVWRYDEPIASFVAKRPDIFHKVST